MKKILSLVLAVVMVFSLGVSAFAADLIELKPAETKTEEPIVIKDWLPLDADNMSVKVSEGGKFYLMLNPDIDYTGLTVNASGNVKASVVKYDAKKYEVEGVDLTYGVWNRLAGEWFDSNNLTYEFAVDEAKTLNDANNVTYYEVRPMKHVNIIEIVIADNFGAAYAEGELVIRAYNEGTKKHESATVKVIRDVVIFEYEQVKWAAQSKDAILYCGENGYSDYETDRVGYGSPDYDYSALRNVKGATVISTTAFRAIAGKGIKVMSDGMEVVIKEVAAGQKGVNFAGYRPKALNAKGEVAENDEVVEKIVFGFYGDQVMSSDFEIVVETGYTWYSLREAFGVKLEENDVITYAVLKDGKLYAEYEVDYSKVNYNEAIKLILDGAAGETLGEYEIVLAETVEVPAEEVEVEVESNPNTGAPVGFFAWLFSLIFG